jgi:hypothetical protein
VLSVLTVRRDSNTTALGETGGAGDSRSVHERGCLRQAGGQTPGQSTNAVNVNATSEFSESLPASFRVPRLQNSM